MLYNGKYYNLKKVAYKNHFQKKNPPNYSDEFLFFILKHQGLFFKIFIKTGVVVTAIIPITIYSM